MVTTSDTINPLDDLNVKKRSTRDDSRVCDVSDPVRKTILATTEFYRGLAEAMADGLRAFNQEFDPRTSSKDFSTGVIDGIAEGNAQFYESMAATSRKAFAHLKTETRDRETIVVIDYALLARMVAAELKKSDTESTD